MDAHTHRPTATSHLYVLSSQELTLGQTSSRHFCVGIHPWHVSRHSVEQVLQLASDPRCEAIGETGLDRLHPDWNLQVELFEWHVELSEKLKKPLVIHIVRSSSDLLQYLKRHRPTMPWLWHDFTGPLEAIPKLLKLHPRLFFSMGPRAVSRGNFKTLWEAIPADRRLLETDDSGVDIGEVYRNAGVSRAELLDNYTNLFPGISW